MHINILCTYVNVTSDYVYETELSVCFTQIIAE